jgi:hypothetical protein
LISFQLEPTLFRREFKLPGGIDSNGVLLCRYLVDDGMILYLNGKEILRANMPAEPLSIYSRAARSVGPAICISTNFIQVSNFRSGTNVIAAAVCQANGTPYDIYFGLEAHAFTRITSTLPSDLVSEELVLKQVHHKDANEVVVSWPTNFGGYSLFTKPVFGADPLLPEWLQVKDQTNPYTNSVPGGPSRFFRLKKP